MNANSTGSIVSKSTVISNNDQGDNKINQEKDKLIKAQAGKLEELKRREAALSRLLAAVRLEKLEALRSRPLSIGIVGFGRFGQFIARTFSKHGRVVVTSRSDYTDIANGMGVMYKPLSNLDEYFDEDLDVVVLATSIVSFEDTVKNIAPHLHNYIRAKDGNKAPLIVDVLSVKEHPRQILLEHLPKECDILCTHPMFGPDSGKNGWHGLNFVYERTRIDGVLLDPSQKQTFHQMPRSSSDHEADTFIEKDSGVIHSLHENSESHIESMDRMERFLSIWEEEGCRMVALSCKEHDEYGANSQFITHLMGRILGSKDLSLRPTPIDTKGFESVMKLIESTTADSFDLFYGLYKYNQNSLDTIVKLRDSMSDVVGKLKEMEEEDQ
eukprot:CAMPEP_0184857468 /NCGR_PEP_ID=MMETSP0580-20130426/2619_1 /TAXON_ID=1118495 /ORGANISM="Dactyliosolen fragilissimus" /LENGTH=382 /DNA_ID=CAMNT_0027353075 /DNA_START=146 /DNA_END=1294 /DNA_ORIENTATION=+